MGLIIIGPILWVLLRGERSGEPDDVHGDYRTKEFFQYLPPRLSESPIVEWYKIKKEGDLNWLLTENPVRLTIVHSLLQGAFTYKSLYEKVVKELNEYFNLNISEQSYTFHFDWLTGARVIFKENGLYHLAPLTSEMINLINKKFRAKMKNI